MMTPSTSRVVVHDELAGGRRELNARFQTLPPRTFSAGKLLAASVPLNRAIYRVVAGWACQYHNFLDGHQAIVDIYLPGDVIGLEGAFFPQTPDEIMALTSLITQQIDTDDALADIMTSPRTALYVAWLLARRQRRVDRLVAVISSLDARGRLATMILHFYRRLSHRRLVTGTTFNLPLTQAQIGAYLGLTVAHVNRVLRSFCHEQIANVEKHCVTILDFDRLAVVSQSGPIVRSIAGPESSPRYKEPTPITTVSSAEITTVSYQADTDRLRP
jgi:CRP-like cAMP-binding protein